MDHQAEHELSHRQQREHKNEEEHKQTEPKMILSAVHPAWYIVVAVIACGLAVLIWTVIS